MKTSQVSHNPLCLVAALERSVAVKGQVCPNSRGGGQTCQIGKGGVTLEKLVKCPSQSLSSGSSSQEAQTRASPVPSSSTPDSPRSLPQKGAQHQAPEARAGRLRRSPRRRHAKSQNGCPKVARTAQLVRVQKQASVGKGEDDSGRAVARTNAP